MTNLNELQFFVQVSQTQSFTKAAKRLGVPKSSVSRAIHRLETRLGVRLVERTTRRVALTEVGELYLDREGHRSPHPQRPAWLRLHSSHRKIGLLRLFHHPWNLYLTVMGISKKSDPASRSLRSN